MKAALYSLVGLVSAFNHQQPDPNRYVYQREVPQDFPVPPELQDPIANPSNFPERAFEELDPRDVLPPLPTRQEQDEIYRSTRPQHEPSMQARHMLEKPPPTIVQGTSVQTWTFLPEHDVQRIQVDLHTEGRPMEALVELWQGPTNVPQKLRVYAENGQKCPFSTLIEIPAEYNTLAVRNIGNLQFPLGAIVVDADTVRPNYSNPLYSERVTRGPNKGRIIQGNAMGTFNFDRNVVSLQVVLQSDGGPVSARIELTQGPSNTKQFIDVYSQDGMTYPVSLVLETPGRGKVVRIQNTAQVAFPIRAWVEPCTLSNDDQKVEVVAKEARKQYILPEDLGANGHPSDKKDAVDIEFQKVVMNDPSGKFSRRYPKRDGPEGRPSGTLPYFWAKSGLHGGGEGEAFSNGHEHQPTNGFLKGGEDYYNGQGRQSFPQQNGFRNGNGPEHQPTNSFREGGGEYYNGQGRQSFPQNNVFRNGEGFDPEHESFPPTTNGLHP